MMFPIRDPETGEITGYAPGRVVTCLTEGCENEGIELEVPDDGSEVICGPCGVPIDSSVPAEPADEPEAPGSTPGVSS